MNFKYKIGTITQLGIIESRYHMQWENRNGGQMMGDFYVMRNGRHYNEFLLEKVTRAKVTKCLIPSKDKNGSGIAVPEIKGLILITTSMIEIEGVCYEQFEYAPDYVDLSIDGNAKRIGDSIYITVDDPLFDRCRDCRENTYEILLSKDCNCEFSVGLIAEYNDFLDDEAAAQYEKDHPERIAELRELVNKTAEEYMKQNKL